MRIEINPEALKSGQLSSPTLRSKKPSPGVEPLGGIHFQQLLQNIYDAVLVTELSGEVLVANIRANTFFLSEPGQLKQYNILALICGSDDSLLPTILKTLAGNRFVLIQALCTRLDGTTFPAEISVNRLGISGKACLSFFVRDVTVRKESEDQLRTGYAAIQNASSGIAIAGLDAEIQYCNPSFLAYFGRSSDQEEETHNFREFLCQPALTDELIAVLGQGETWNGELEFKTANGEMVFGRTSATPNLNTDGELVGMVLSVLDVTPQKRAQQQLQAYAEELHRKNMQMEEDLKMASELHQACLPRELEGFPRGVSPEASLLNVRHLYHPSGTIGGDFFDILEVSEHEVAIFICDVMGHGIRSALVVATIRGLIEQLRPLAGDPGGLMTQLNSTYSAIFKHMGGDVTFATALYLVFDTDTGVLRYANASHPRPYILRPGLGEVGRLGSKSQRPSSALGLFAKAVYDTVTSELNPGDLLLLYTDGLAEVENPEHEFYESHRFEQTLRDHFHAQPKALLQRLLEDARDFSQAPAFEDDICLVSLQVASGDVR